VASQNEIAQMIEQAAARYGVAPEALMTIANIESSGNVSAQNPRSSASGLFQFVDRTAREYGLTGNRRNDPAAQADAAARMMATNSRSLERTLGRTPQPGELYLAHQQGLTGATALLRNPNRPAIDVLTEVYGGDRSKAQNAVRLNGGNANMNAGQFAGTWVNKANQRTAMVPPGSLPDNAVATQLDVRRPVTGSPQTMPASLGAQRQLTAQLSGGQQSAPDASFYNGIFAQQPRSTPSSASVNNTVRSTQAAQMPLLANSLEQYAQQQAFRTPVQTQTVAQVPTRPAAQPRQPNAAEKAALNYVAPPRSQLPPVAPSNTASPRVFSETTARTAAATQPALQSALQRLAAPKPMTAAQQRADNGQARPAARTIPSSVVNESIARAQAATNPALQSALANRAAPVATAALNAPTMTSAQRSSLSSVGGVGQPPATRVVPSVPWGQPAIPGPNAAPKDQSRLTPQGGLPIAASAAAPGPPIMISGAAPARQSVTGFPTPASQRPTGGIFAQSAPVARPVARMPVMSMPTAANLRPVARQPLAVVVQGAQTQQPSYNPANHSAAQLAAVSNGQSTFVSSPGSVGEPVYAMNGKLRNTY
jgi:hypothetical protein